MNEHTAELRKQYPNIEIFTRRDNDGFPIIKLAMKREYKYNLDDIMNADPEQLQRIQNETLEALLGVFMPEDPKEFVDKAAAGDAFDGVDQEALANLIEKRFTGEYKEDLEGFTQQCQLLRKEQVKELKKGKKRPMMAKAGLGFQSLLDARFAQRLVQNEALHDQERFDREIQEQIALRVREKQNFSKLSEEDLVRPARSENLMYRDQVQTLSDTIRILEKDNEWLLKQSGQQTGGDQDGSFDQEKFNQVKKEIRLRKEAKERVLNQGFPEFKPYVRM